MDVNRAAVDGEMLVLDYESTGTLHGFPDEPWQIGIVSLSSGQIDPASQFESLLRIDINRPFNPHAPGRHDQLREEMMTAPTPQKLWLHMKERLLGLPLCAHNAATEKRFIRKMAPMHQFGPWIDTLRIARRAWPSCPSYALEDLVVYLGIKPRVDALCPGRAAHDALYDAVAAAALLSHLLDQPEWKRITLAELASI